MRKGKILLIPAIFLISFLSISGQNLVLPANFPDYTISVNNSPDEGYLFITTDGLVPKGPASLVIADNYGTPVFYQQLINKSGGFSLKRNDLLGFFSYNIYVVELFVMDSSYTIIDTIRMDDHTLDSHDFLAFDNGHYLIFGLDKRTVDLTEYGGVADATATGCIIRELDENKNIMFEWNSWDHFEITDTYKNLRTSSVDLVHPNTLEIDHDGNILLISRSMNEVTKISRSSGNIMWRLGGKNNEFTFSDSSQMFSMPHDIRLLDNGNYSIFDNGNNKDPKYSRAIEYDLDEENKTIDLVWEYDADKELFAPHGGSTQRLPSGNTILNYGGAVSKPSVIEVHPDGSKAFQLDFVGDFSTTKAVKYPWRTTLFEPNTYQVNFGEWDGSTSSEYILSITNNSDESLTLTGYSTRTEAFTVLENFPIEIPARGQSILSLSFFPSTLNYGYINDVLTIDSDIISDTLIRRVSQQIELIGTQTDNIPPIPTIIFDGMVDIPLDTIISIEFSEPIRHVNEDIFSYESIDQIFLLKSIDSNGVDIPFDAVINSDKNRVEILPEQDLEQGQSYYVSVSDEYADYSGNKGSFISGSFTCIDLFSPALIDPSDGSVGVNPDDPITITFENPVRNTDDSNLTQISLGEIIDFKYQNSEGENLAFSATINEDNTVITISPGERLAANTSYYVSLLEGIEDFNDIPEEAIVSVFTTGNYTDLRSKENAVFNIFPNPGSGIYTIKVNDIDNYIIQLYDITGKMICQEEKSSFVNYKLDISTYANGLYLLKLSASNSGKVAKVLLIKE